MRRVVVTVLGRFLSMSEELPEVAIETASRWFALLVVGVGLGFVLYFGVVVWVGSATIPELVAAPNEANWAAIWLALVLLVVALVSWGTTALRVAQTKRKQLKPDWLYWTEFSVSGISLLGACIAVFALI